MLVYRNVPTKNEELCLNAIGWGWIESMTDEALLNELEFYGAFAVPDGEDEEAEAALDCEWHLRREWTAQELRDAIDYTELGRQLLSNCPIEWYVSADGTTFAALDDTETLDDVRNHRSQIHVISC